MGPLLFSLLATHAGLGEMPPLGNAQPALAWELLKHRIQRNHRVPGGSSPQEPTSTLSPQCAAWSPPFPFCPAPAEVGMDEEQRLVALCVMCHLGAQHTPTGSFKSERQPHMQPLRRGLGGLGM